MITQVKKTILIFEGFKVVDYWKFLDFCPKKPQKVDFLGKNVGVYSNSVVVAV